MTNDHNWLNYTQALKEFPSALLWAIMSIICKIGPIYRRVPEKYSFKIAAAGSTFKLRSFFDGLP